jgi:hypothetical protein
MVGAAKRFKAVLVVSLPKERCPGLWIIFSNVGS